MNPRAPLRSHRENLQGLTTMRASQYDDVSKLGVGEESSCDEILVTKGVMKTITTLNESKRAMSATRGAT